MSFEFDEDVYTSRQVIGEAEEPKMASLYQKLGVSPQNVKKAMLVTPIVCFGLSIAILLWYFL